MTQRILLLTLLVAAFLASGCASRSYRFDGVGPEGTRGRQVRYVLESGAGNEGSITLAARGRAYEEVGGRETDTVRVRVTLDNASDDALVVPLEGVELRDDEGRTWQRMDDPLADGTPGSAIEAAPRSRISVDLLYDAGAPGTLRTTGSVQLGWGYRFRGQDTRHSTRFLPVRREYGRVSWSLGFGYGHGGWYGPHWGPSWRW